MHGAGLIVAAVALATASGPATVSHGEATEPLPQRLATLASGFCVEVLDGTAALPAPGAASAAFFDRYGLTDGASSEAITALGTTGTPLISRATLASGRARDGAFILALGGSAGETCRVVVYKAPLDRLAVMQTLETLRTAAFGWKSLPPPPQTSAAISVRSFRRGKAGLPFLASLVAPVAEGPVSMVLTVAAIPRDVKLPEGY